jgi:acyl carrier protein
MAMEKLLAILKDIRPDVDFENETRLIDNGILDSFDVVSIISEIDDVFDVQIRISELEPENFNSVESIWNLINILKNNESTKM